LVANNFRDRFSDAKAGKKTSIVLFGEKFGIYFYLLNGILATLVCQYFWLEETFGAALLPFIYLFFHIKTWKKMVAIRQGRLLIKILEQSAGNVLIFGLLLTLGLTLTQTFPTPTGNANNVGNETGTVSSKSQNRDDRDEFTIHYQRLGRDARQCVPTGLNNKKKIPLKYYKISYCIFAIEWIN
jgi:hypothetical protein